MGFTAAAVVAGAATASSYYQGQQQAKATERASQQAQANAIKQEKAADQATNRANQKKPDTMAILDSATMASKAGGAGTMLTGPSGVDPSVLQLGKNTLLGS